MRRLLSAVLVIVALGLGAFFFHATLFFNAEALVRRREAALVAEVTSGEKKLEELMKRSRWHRGEPPCFAYAPPHPSALDLEAIADDLAAAGSSSAATENLSLLAFWAAADERRRHGDPAPDEVLSSFEDLGWHDRLLVALHRSKVVDASFKRVRQRESDARADAARREAALAPEKLAALRNDWLRHRLRLPVTALLPLRRALERRQRGAEQK